MNGVEGLISISAAARAVGLNRSTVSRQVKAGFIRSHDGKVKLSEVREDRTRNVNSRHWEARMGAYKVRNIAHAKLRWEAIDCWRLAQVDTPDRPEAVRRLVEIALSSSEI